MPNYRQSGTSNPYSGSASTRAALTSERIAADIAAFNKAGGRIEVLGNTPFHHRPKEADASAHANGASMAPKQSSDKK
ncbi:hypothetical protein ACFFJT_20600 [Dyella flava]|uniref:Uncharacterized protein n=1 Tax=Dyella flava TaxID=1920170 RepID=A0ABS2JXP6_9GAMM|nr:hypothetical protein [Dyella flava]MBM7123764.1 hypothetical protein [Dyella flava]GLQ52628.1 hypothetical protein GCM10010872_40770 [Dyella flava]